MNIMLAGGESKADELGTWRNLAYQTEMDQKTANEFWGSYFTQEKAIYEQILSDPDSVSGVVCTEVRALDEGYLLQTSSASPLRLQGVWRISTDVSSYYVNCKTGEITRE